MTARLSGLPVPLISIILAEALFFPDENSVKRWHELASVCRDWSVIMAGDEILAAFQNGDKILSAATRVFSIKQVPTHPICESFSKSIASRLSYCQVKSLSWRDIFSLNFYAKNQQARNYQIRFLQWMQKMPANCRQFVTHLDFTGTNFDLPSRLNIIRMFPNLASLILDESRNKTCDFMRDANLRRMLELCPHLRKLTIKSCPLLTENIFFDLAKLTPKLWSLSVLDCYSCQVQNTTLGAFLMQTDELYELNIPGQKLLTYGAIENLARYCGRLTRLNINNCHQIKDGGMQKLFECPELTHLSCQGLELTGDTFWRLATSELPLRYVDASFCRSLTPDDLDKVREARPELKLIAHGLEPLSTNLSLVAMNW